MLKKSTHRIFILLIIILIIIVTIAECVKNKNKKSGKSAASAGKNDGKTAVGKNDGKTAVGKNDGKNAAVCQKEPSSSSSKIETEEDQNAEMEMEKLGRELLHAKLEKNELKKGMEKMEKENVDLKTGMEKMQKENDDLKTGMEKMQKENVALKTGMEKMKKENVELKNKMEKIEKENVELKIGMEKIEKENVELKNKMEILKIEKEKNYIGKCSVCLDPIKFNEISAIKCGHTFHYDCINPWININKNCPICKTEMETKDIIRQIYIDESDKITIDSLTTLIDEILWADYDSNEYKLLPHYGSPHLNILKGGVVYSDKKLNSIRTDVPIPIFNLNYINEQPIIYFYFEMEIRSENFWTAGIGYCDDDFPLEGESIGHKNNSIGIWNKGRIWIDGKEKKFGNVEGHFRKKDFVGIGIIHHPSNPNSSWECFATCNGELLGKVELPLKFAEIKIYPAVTLNKADDSVRVIFEKDSWRFTKFKKLFVENDEAQNEHITNI